MNTEKTNSSNKNHRKIIASCKRTGEMKSINTVRNFSFPIDEPIKLGGSDEAPTPMEYILGSFNGCILIVVETIAKEIGFTFKSLRSESVGTIDRRGMQGVDNISPHFQNVTNTIWFETTESVHRIPELKKLVQKRCPAYNLFLDAGINITLDWIYLEKGGEQ
ncbi:OsmC family protein [Pseudogracilibacillus sp. SE30717A]|uniref:OsmC family protein n=1 Tax=Pseudogracilibacillus sp. SE30717A TaxID=3098293 RepID=UPI00300DCB06